MATPSSRVFDDLPDLIKAVALEIGVDFTSVLADEETPKNSYNYVPPELKKAYAKADSQTIQKFNQAAARDLDPIFSNLRQNEQKAWVSIINKSNGQEYWISVAGDPAQPSGWMWSYTNPVAVSSTADGQGPPTIHTCQVGTLSRNTKMLGVSFQLWENKYLMLGVGAIVTAITHMISKYIAKRIAGTAFAEAIAEAIAVVGEGLIARGLTTAAAWAASKAFIFGAVGGAVAGAILTWLIMFIIEFVYREYKLAIQVYNWTKKNYAITAWAGDNALFDNKEAFRIGALPARPTQIGLPDGFAPVTGELPVAYATYVFINNNQVLEGLTAALKVDATEGSGLLLAYYLGRFKDNLIALGKDTSQPLNQFLAKSESYAPKGTLKLKMSLPDGTPVLCSTPALSGRDDYFYEFRVHIGLEAESGFEDAPAIIPHEKRAEPIVPEPLSVGDFIEGPDGTRLEVVATFD